MAVTPNLNLYLPDEDDYASNERDLNDNFEKIDGAFGTFGEVIENTGSATYATWKSDYVKYGKICVFSVEFTPKQNISSSIGDIDFRLPTPASQVVPAPVAQKGSIAGTTVSDYINRYFVVSANTARGVGTYSSGVTYTASGAYITN